MKSPAAKLAAADTLLEKTLRDVEALRAELLDQPEESLIWQPQFQRAVKAQAEVIRQLLKVQAALGALRKKPRGKLKVES